MLTQNAENQARCFITIFRSVVGFTKAEPRGIWICKSPNTYVREFFICIWEYARA